MPSAPEVCRCEGAYGSYCISLNETCGEPDEVCMPDEQKCLVEPWHAFSMDAKESG